jgi:hypothetical protein
MRTSGISFGVLAFYPILLLLAEGPRGVGVASTVWGIGLGGVMMGWMLGPVALARRKEDVPAYSGIHATLVGLRGVVFQGLGMLLYQLSGVFGLPLIMAALLFATSAVMMWMLHQWSRLQGGGAKSFDTPLPGPQRASPVNEPGEVVSAERPDA